MAFVRPKDRVLETSATFGSGPWTLAGAVSVAHNAFSASMLDGDTTTGCIIEPNVAFATGTLTFNTGPNRITLTATTETKGTFGAGTKELMMGTPASLDVYRKGDQTIDGNLSVGISAFITGTLAVSGNTVALGAGGTGGGVVANVIANGGSGTNSGAAVSFQRNSVLLWQIGNSSGVLGGASDDLVVYSNVAAVAALTINKTTISATFGGAVITVASSTARAGLKITAGTAPTSPADGEVWQDGSNLLARIGGANRTLTQLSATTTVLTSGTGATYTTPAGVKWLEIKVKGGGGGGGGGQNASPGAAGVNSVFNTTIIGGGGGGGGLGVAGVGGPASGGYVNIPGCSGSAGGIPGINANAVGGTGGGSGGTPGSIGSSTANSGTAGSGGGGGGGGATNATLTGAAGGGGGEGGTAFALISNPAATYTYTVGSGNSGASGGSSSTSAGGTGGNGGSGRIEIIEHYG